MLNYGVDFLYLSTRHVGLFGEVDGVETMAVLYMVLHENLQIFYTIRNQGICSASGASRTVC